MSRSEDVLLAVLEVDDPDERKKRLTDFCGDDTQLRSDVEAQLQKAARADDYFRGLAKRVGLSTSADDDASLVGKRMGAYRLVRLLGRGGMGSVYVGKRDDEQFDKDVAVKVLFQYAGPGATERFVAERRFLARMEHPGIARLLDGGISDEGALYFVMELVDGEPIVAHASKHALSIADRLRLFCKACDAVAYAHRNLIVHRDLKPDHILVTGAGAGAEAEAGAGAVKLLDFGIAKLVDPEMGLGESTVTKMAGQPMTLVYASPEQIRGEAITTASDVYSLGVVLHELLVGKPPFARKGKTLSELRQALESETVSKPSTLLSGADGRLLHGDLDTIVAKTLHPDPERRYASVQQLGDDIRHHLAGRPVLARSDTWRYLASRFVRRHRAAVAAAVVVAVALVTVALLSVRFAVATATQSRRIAQERDKSQAVTAFLVDLFEASNPGLAKGETVTARDLLDRGAKRLGEGELKNKPEARANLMAVIGRVYLHLGFYDEADKLIRQGLQLRERLYGPVHFDVARSAHNLGRLLHYQGKNEQAEAHLGRALAIYKGQDGGPALAQAEPMDLLAGLLSLKGKNKEAEAMYRESLTIRETELGEDMRVAVGLNNLGTFLSDLGRYDEAEKLLLRALALDRKLLAPDHPAIAYELNNLAYLYVYGKGDYAAGIRLLEEVVATFRKTLGPEHPNVLTAMGNVASVQQKRGDYMSAESLHREVLLLVRKVRGEDHPAVATREKKLASVLATLGRLDEAERLQKRSLAARTKALGKDHVSIADNLLALGFIAAERKDFALAEDHVRKAYAMQHKAYGDGHPGLAYNAEALARVLRPRAKFDEAEKLLVTALATRRKQNGDDHPVVARDLCELANIARDRGDVAGAEKKYAEATAIYRKRADPNHPFFGECLLERATLLVESGRAAEARPVLSEAQKILAARLPAGHSRLVRIAALSQRLD